MNQLDDLTLSAMQKLATPDRPKMQEETFVQKLLPQLAPLPNDLNPQSPVVERRELLVWTEWFQSPHTAVDIHDRAGHLLFTLPGPLPQARTETERRKDAMPITEVINHAQLHAANHPALGDAYLSKQMDERIEIITDENASILARWNAVFKRYNYPLMIAADGSIPLYVDPTAVVKSDVEIKDVDNTPLFADDDDEIL